MQWRRGTEVVRAVPLDDEAEAIRVLRALRHFGGSFFRDYLASQGVGDTDEELARSWQRLHVLRLEPTAGPGPTPLRPDLAWVWLAPLAALCVRWLVREHG